MSIINILMKMAILLVCSIIQVFGVLVEGISKIFGKIGEYLETLHDVLMEQIEKRKLTKKAAVDVPL